MCSRPARRCRHDCGHAGRQHPCGLPRRRGATRRGRPVGLGSLTPAELQHSATHVHVKLACVVEQNASLLFGGNVTGASQKVAGVDLTLIKFSSSSAQEMLYSLEEMCLFA